MSLAVDNDIINYHLVNSEYIKYMKQRCEIPAGPWSEKPKCDSLGLQIVMCRAHEGGCKQVAAITREEDKRRKVGCNTKMEIQMAECFAGERCVQSLVHCYSLGWDSQVCHCSLPRGIHDLHCFQQVFIFSPTQYNSRTLLGPRNPPFLVLQAAKRNNSGTWRGFLEPALLLCWWSRAMPFPGTNRLCTLSPWLQAHLATAAGSGTKLGKRMKENHELVVSPEQDSPK